MVVAVIFISATPPSTETPITKKLVFICKLNNISGQTKSHTACDAACAPVEIDDFPRDGVYYIQRQHTRSPMNL